MTSRFVDEWKRHSVGTKGDSIYEAILCYPIGFLFTVPEVSYTANYLASRFHLSPSIPDEYVERAVYELSLPNSSWANNGVSRLMKVADGYVRQA